MNVIIDFEDDSNKGDLLNDIFKIVEDFIGENEVFLLNIMSDSEEDDVGR